MQLPSIHFTDGANYERYMGVWSQLVGKRFLDWLALKPDLRWLDVGCGNGAFTEMLANDQSPCTIHGIDPSEQQLAYARTRIALATAELRAANAMDLPFADDTFDIAVMPLVIFFVTNPGQGIAEMNRVVCPGGMVAAYAWDMEGGGFPYHALHTEMRNMGIKVPTPPSPEASRIDVMTQLWRDAGLIGIDTCELAVSRTFANFDDYWTTAFGAPSVGKQLAELTPADMTMLKERMRTCLTADATGCITYSARANAIKGLVAQGT